MNKIINPDMNIHQGIHASTLFDVGQNPTNEISFLQNKISEYNWLFFYRENFISLLRLLALAT